MRKLETAISIALMAHDNVVDKAGLPYILHPMKVMMSETPVLIGVPGSPMRPFTPEEMCVAVLHDVKEDAPEYWEVIKVKFADYPEIIEAIDAISKRKGETLEEYYARVMANEIAHRVKLADMEHNMSFDRIICIEDAATRDRLTKKYAKGYAILTKVGD